MGWIQNIGYMQQVLWDVGCMRVSSYFPQENRRSWQMFERITQIALGAMGLLYTLDFFSPFLPLTFKAAIQGILTPFLGCLCISLILGVLNRGYQSTARPCMATSLRIHNRQALPLSISHDNRLSDPTSEAIILVQAPRVVSENTTMRENTVEKPLRDEAIHPPISDSARIGSQEGQACKASREDKCVETDMTNRKRRKVKKLQKVARCLLPEFEEVARQEGLC
ncbi:hypothetical protein [Candidatus Protochlamydia phocaeensis]|uniref:hypothetical protein n=1 Tax=Candidatus Protochlamydia phocaeensis TaxID=1414722 RepID=UPI000837B6C7|nr:hypothetical protein [Candidatus Protochlamydia phocaeensis]